MSLSPAIKLTRSGPPGEALAGNFTKRPLSEPIPQSGGAGKFRIVKTRLCRGERAASDASYLDGSTVKIDQRQGCLPSAIRAGAARGNHGNQKNVHPPLLRHSDGGHAQITSPSTPFFCGHTSTQEKGVLLPTLMLLKRLLLLLAVCALLCGNVLAKPRGSSPSKRTQTVHGYTTKTGKHVNSYKRAPSGTSDAPKKHTK